MGHPTTPTELFLGPVGGPYTSLSWSWGQGTPRYSHKFSSGAVGDPDTSLG